MRILRFCDKTVAERGRGGNRTGRMGGCWFLDGKQARRRGSAGGLRRDAWPPSLREMLEVDGRGVHAARAGQ